MEQRDRQTRPDDRPRLFMIGTDIRRDLLAPLAGFRKLQPVVFYRRAPYDDLLPDELPRGLVQYHGTGDLMRKLASSRPAILQGVEPFSLRLLPDLLVIGATARLRRIPLFVVTFENRPIVEKCGRFGASLLRLLLPGYFRQARLICYLNDGARRNLLATGAPPDRLRRCLWGTWGVDVNEFSPVSDGHELAFGTPTVLFVGRVDEAKGVLDLVRAMPIVRQEVPGARLVIVGAGPASARIGPLAAELGLSDAISLTGTVKNRDLPPYFRSATVFASPSRTTTKWEEQVGMTNIQSLACGTPVVSTRSGAIPEFIPDGKVGLLVPEGDIPGLARAITALLGNERLRRRFQEAGRRLAVERYDAAANVRIAEEMLLATYLPELANRAAVPSAAR